MHNSPRTTATLLTPPGRGGIAVIHLAGPSAESIISTVFRPAYGKDIVFDPQTLQLGHLVSKGEMIDEVLVCAGNFSAEINIHGGPVSSRRSLQALAEAGAEIVPARAPGAFDPIHPMYNNPAVGTEMLALLPEAPSVCAAGMLSCQWTGGISRLCRTSIDLLSAGRDEPSIAKDLTAAADLYSTADRLLHPPEVVIAGLPNTGKSTLANRLTGREVAIVSEVPGTTRDWVREKAMIDNKAIWLTDTAGLWQTRNTVDAEAVDRAMVQVHQADLILLLQSEQDQALPSNFNPTCPVIRIASRCDTWEPAGNFDARISVVQDTGIKELSALVLEKLNLSNVDPSAACAFTEKQATLLEQAARAISDEDSTKAIDCLTDLLEGSLA